MFLSRGTFFRLRNLIMNYPLAFNTFLNGCSKAIIYWWGNIWIFRFIARVHNLTTTRNFCCIRVMFHISWFYKISGVWFSYSLLLGWSLRRMTQIINIIFSLSRFQIYQLTLCVLLRNCYCCQCWWRWLLLRYSIRKVEFTLNGARN